MTTTMQRVRACDLPIGAHFSKKPTSFVYRVIETPRSALGYTVYGITHTGKTTSVPHYQQVYVREPDPARPIPLHRFTEAPVTTTIEKTQMLTIPENPKDWLRASPLIWTEGLLPYRLVLRSIDNLDTPYVVHRAVIQDGAWHYVHGSYCAKLSHAEIRFRDRWNEHVARMAIQERH